MKKTTYILIAGVCALVLFAFFSPVIFFSAGPERPQITHTLDHRDVDTTINIVAEGYSKLILPDYKYSDFTYDDYSQSLRFNIEQVDSIDHVQIVVDASWAPLIETDIRENALSISFKSPEKEKVNERYFIPADNMFVGTICLPKDHVSQIDARMCKIGIIQNYIKHSLKVENVQNVELVNCEIAILTIN